MDKLLQLFFYGLVNLIEAEELPVPEDSFILRETLPTIFSSAALSLGFRGLAGMIVVR